MDLISTSSNRARLPLGLVSGHKSFSRNDWPLSKLFPQNTRFPSLCRVEFLHLTGALLSFSPCLQHPYRSFLAPLFSMSDSGLQRRHPSPLVFTPDSVLAAVPPQLHHAGSSSSHGSGSNTVSMPFVRRHVTRRLKAAKAECDSQLQRVTNNITAFFEERLRDGDHETERELRDRERGRERDRDRDSQLGDPEPLSDAFVFHPGDLRSALQTDESSSDGGYEAEVEYSRHSRQRAYLDEDTYDKAPLLTHWSSSPGLLAASSASSMSPVSSRRQTTTNWDKPQPLSASASTSALSSSPSTFYYSIARCSHHPQAT